MGQTLWLQRTTFEQPKSWLLANGEVVHEPPLEETSSGRKVRIAGTNMSAFSRDMDSLIGKAVQLLAAQKQTTVWMPLHGAEAALAKEAGFKPAATRPELHILKTDLSADTMVWWRFRHASLPIEAVLYVRSARVSSWDASSPHTINTRLVGPDTQARFVVAPQYLKYEDGTFWAQASALHPDNRDRAREFVRDNPAPWEPDAVLGASRHPSSRQMVKALLEKVRQVDELDTIQIPDLRNLDQPGWLDLKLCETNLNASFLSDLTEYLEGTPTVAEALRIYKELQMCLRGIGLVMEDKTENDFQKGLLGGEAQAVTVELSHPHDEGGGTDTAHSLSMHLPTGTFIVNCDMRVNPNVVADRWDEAHTIASLSGEEDTLLAFAREYTRRGQEQRSKAIIKERKGSADS